MLLIGRHGTTKHVVRSLVLQWKHTKPLSHCYATTSLRLSDTPSSTGKSAPTGSDHPEKSYAVLGGGVTGLSAAYFLTRKFPNAKVTIYEASKRLGGWVDSEIVEVDGGQALFEWGPRSLRPDFSGPGSVTIQLVRCSLWRRKQRMLTIRPAA
jgi:NAD(P)-binding Rossmann-like domain